MAAGDLYRLKAHQTVTQQSPLLNVYYYEHISGVGGWNELADEFETSVQGVLLYMQSQTTLYTSFEVENLDDPLDWGTLAATVNPYGAVSGEVMPTHVCISVRLNRASRDSRHGWKRIGAVSESWNENGKLPAATWTACQNGADAIVADLDDGSNVWRPRIVRVTVTGEGEEKVTTYTPFPVASGTFRIYFGSQNSRKNG